MTSIADVVGRSERLAELKANAEQRAAAVAAEWEETAVRNGWPPDAACHACGDTGHRPDWNRMCERCDAATKLRAQQRERDRLATWDRLIPPRFRDYRLGGCPNQGAAMQVASWMATAPWPRGENLILSGPVGTGKTGLLVGAMRAIWEDQGSVIAFVGVPAMLDQMRPGNDDDPMDRLRDALVLGLDDLGAEKPTDWVRERLYVLVNARYEAKRSTIVTTNCNLGELAATIGERTVSRLQEGATIVRVAGEDRRR